MRATPAEQLGEEELRQRIRARLWPTIGTDLEDFPYARRIVTGLAQVLCLDYPTSVACLMGDRPHHLALPIDELYAQGLANVLAEPCPAPQQTSIEGLFEISDGSLWIASKAASFGSLVPDVIGPAPRGAFLMVPRDDLLCYAPVVGEDWMRLPGIVANLAMALAREAHSEGAMLSPIAYYWAPDGTLERCSGNSPEGELAVTPGPAFTRYLLEVGTDQ
jgi:hypothetical protein